MMEILENDECSCRMTGKVRLLLMDYCRGLSMVNMYYGSLVSLKKKILRTACLL